jgi:uncharacterized LabA/DUF88 family protein
MKRRLACFIDGFNLYHAIKDINKNHLKWVNLWRLMEVFKAPDEDLVNVYYFSAFAWHRTDGAPQRHLQYVKGLEFYGVSPILGRFKEKDLDCRNCGRSWVTHEEKESDVNIGLYMLDGAYRQEFDKAILVSTDSDLVPVIRMMKERFPSIPVKVIAPPERMHSKEMAKEVKKRASIKRIHLELCLLPEKVVDADGKLIATRPKEYTPPS